MNEFEQFALLMKREMETNASKGDWRGFTDLAGIMGELEYHKHKLAIAVEYGDKERIQEYSADCANFLLMLLNATNTLYL